LRRTVLVLLLLPLALASVILARVTPREAIGTLLYHS